MILHLGSLDNVKREQKNLTVIDWKEEKKLAREQFGRKTRDARRFELSKGKKTTPYFTHLPIGPLQYFFYIDEKKNEESAFFRAASSFEPDSEANKQVADKLYVSEAKIALIAMMSVFFFDNLSFY
jgi:hypothetical protein